MRTYVSARIVLLLNYSSAIGILCFILWRVIAVSLSDTLLGYSPTFLKQTCHVQNFDIKDVTGLVQLFRFCLQPKL